MHDHECVWWATKNKKRQRAHAHTHAHTPMTEESVDELDLKKMDIDSVTVSSFPTPQDAFYWLGSLAGLRPQRRLPEKPQQPEDVCDFAVFDTETSGLSRQDCAIQVAIAFFDSDGNLIGSYDKLWKLPHGRRVSRGSYEIHKISDQKLAKEGVEALTELSRVSHIFATVKRRRKKIVAHNASFDARILKQTATQHEFQGWTPSQEEVFCTMRSATPFCGLVSQKTGRTKAPSNAQLYNVLTGREPDAATLHDAFADVKVTGESYFRGRRAGWWS